MADRNSIETLFRTHYLRLYRLAAAMLRDDDQARDIVHDVFASLLNRREMEGVTGAYLVRAVRNRCINLIGSLEIREKARRLYYLEAEKYDSDRWPDEETLSKINEIIRRELTPQKRRIMQLRFGEGLSSGKVAEELMISETAVYKHIRQAVATIRKKLEANG